MLLNVLVGMYSKLCYLLASIMIRFIIKLIINIFHGFITMLYYSYYLYSMGIYTPYIKAHIMKGWYINTE